jgi:hypothetical protein
MADLSLDHRKCLSMLYEASNLDLESVLRTSDPQRAAVGTA